MLSRSSSRLGGLVPFWLESHWLFNFLIHKAWDTDRYIFRYIHRQMRHSLKLPFRVWQAWKMVTGQKAQPAYLAFPSQINNIQSVLQQSASLTTASITALCLITASQPNNRKPVKQLPSNLTKPSQPHNHHIDPIDWRLECHKTLLIGEFSHHKI